jgi:hypothetical protein
MSNLEIVDVLAEQLRREPYHLLTNDCITKSRRLQKDCRKLGIPVKVVVCLGITRARWFGHWLNIPVIHGWGEMEGHRIETSRPLGSSGIWSIVPVNIRPLATFKI